MPPGRLRKAEQLLQQPVHAGRPEQVLAPHHLRHALPRVVDDHREVIAGRRFLARDDDVAPRFGPGGDRPPFALRAFAALAPAQFAGARACGRHIEPQRVRNARSKQPRTLAGRKQSRRSGIVRHTVGVARPWRLGFPLPDQARNLGAALETRVDQTLRHQCFERIAVVGEMFGLPAHRGFPGDAEPGKVLIHRLLEFFPAPRRVDILDAQQEPAASLACQVEIQQRRKGVAKMQIAVWTWRKSENGWRN